MKIFCIDIGNTHTHCATVDDSSYAVSDSAEYDSASFASMFSREGLFEKSGADAIAWCSVVPRYSGFLEAVMPKHIESFHLTWKNSPICLDVKKPSSMGEDRIADAVGAGLIFKPPYIVVDMGTAVTIDFVDESGHYAGGAIAPGMHAFAAYLNERTAQLPSIDPSLADYSLTIGKDTVEAMYVGCAKGFCKLADGIIDDIEREFFKTESAAAKTVFTGGNIKLLPKKWLGERKVEENLAQIGLARAMILNKKV